MAAERKDANPYVFKADLDAHVRERELLIEAGDTTSEEFKAHQVLIMQRRAELAKMPMVPGIMSISTNDETFTFVGGVWRTSPFIHIARIGLKYREIKCDDRTVYWGADGDFGSGDEVIDCGGLDLIGTPVAIQNRVFAVTSDATLIEWSAGKWSTRATRIGGADLHAMAANHGYLFVANAKEVLVINPVADDPVCVIGSIPHTVGDVQHLWIDGDVLVIMGDDCRRWACAWTNPDRAGYTQLPPFREEEWSGRNPWYLPVVTAAQK